MKYTYLFSDPETTEGRKEMKQLLGGKGANLAEMAYLGFPVPQGFTISTDACVVFNKEHKIPTDVADQITEYIAKLEKITGKVFGGEENPLLVSVRSGAAVSMPGMMDTVLNLGLNRVTLKGLLAKTGNPRFVMDSYRRFLQMFGDVVLGIEHKKFEACLDAQKKKRGVENDTDLDDKDLELVATEYEKLIEKETGSPFPQDPRAQLDASIGAVFDSWDNFRAVKYRQLNKIEGLKGTAVNVQTMVFGNTGETSGTGVCFTRDPGTGENFFYGEYLMNAQGEDVVAGIRTPKHLDELEKSSPACYKELCDIRLRLEKHYRDMQDMEFTIEEGKLYMLQTRNGKRTGRAAVKIAVDMVKEGLLTEEEAVLRVEPDQLDQLLHPQLDPRAVKAAKKLGKGLPASPGAAVGKVVFSATKAREMAEKKEKVILVRTETSPDDVDGMNAAVGILTSRGGMTSHAAVVARGMGKTCVAGCGDITVDEDAKYFKTKDQKFVEYDIITLDGSSGVIFGGALPVVDAVIDENFRTIMSYTDKFRTMGVRANADAPKDAKIARDFGAQGIGLCRTEHMFFEGPRMQIFQEMILATDKKNRIAALDKLEVIQQSDFEGILGAMADLPVTIRLLDPPLHEFLPQHDQTDVIETISKNLNVPVAQIKVTIEKLKESNPMLGHRGCRLSLTYPEIAVMQVRAIIKAGIALKKKGINVNPEIMIPLVGFDKELQILEGLTREVADQLIKESGSELEYHVGTMIEVPRGALTADSIAKNAEFFSFGTNDLTQMTLGFSRDDAGVFLVDYIEQGVFKVDPFQSIDTVGVGQLVKLAAKLGREARPDIHLGVCGEHGGDAASVEFFNTVPLDYVSCSPFRVPISRLAAAQAAIKQRK